jgi:hypothetical protein
MLRVGFEPTIQASERAKTVHASDHSDTATGSNMCIVPKITGKSRPFTFTSFQILHSPVIQQFDSVKSQLMKSSLIQI